MSRPSYPSPACSSHPSVSADKPPIGARLHQSPSAHTMHNLSDKRRPDRMLKMAPDVMVMASEYMRDVEAQALAQTCWSSLRVLKRYRIKTRLNFLVCSKRQEILDEKHKRSPDDQTTDRLEARKKFEFGIFMNVWIREHHMQERKFIKRYKSITKHVTKLTIGGSMNGSRTGVPINMPHLDLIMSNLPPQITELRLKSCDAIFPPMGAWVLPDSLVLLDIPEFDPIGGSIDAANFVGMKWPSCLQDIGITRPCKEFVSLPNTIKRIRFESGSWYTLNSFPDIPDSVTEVILTDRFTQPMDGLRLTCNVRTLRLGMKCHGVIPASCLLDGLQTLHTPAGAIMIMPRPSMIDNRLTESGLRAHQLPSSLTDLDMSGWTPSHVTSVPLPHSLLRLKLPESFSQGIEKWILPSNLRELIFGGGFIHPIPDCSTPGKFWPLKLRRLRICMPGDKIPSDSFTGSECRQLIRKHFQDYPKKGYWEYRNKMPGTKTKR